MPARRSASRSACARPTAFKWMPAIQPTGPVLTRSVSAWRINKKVVMSSPYAIVLKAGAAGDRWADRVARVDDDRRAHGLLQLRQLQGAELLPLRDDHQRVGPRSHFLHRLAIDEVEVAARPPRRGHRHRVIRLNHRA